MVGADHEIRFASLFIHDYLSLVGYVFSHFPASKVHDNTVGEVASISVRTTDYDETNKCPTYLDVAVQFHFPKTGDIQKWNANLEDLEKLASTFGKINLDADRDDFEDIDDDMLDDFF